MRWHYCLIMSVWEWEGYNSIPRLLIIFISSLYIWLLLNFSHYITKSNQSLLTVFAHNVMIHNQCSIYIICSLRIRYWTYCLYYLRNQYTCWKIIIIYFIGEGGHELTFLTSYLFNYDMTTMCECMLYNRILFILQHNLFTK